MIHERTLIDNSSVDLSMSQTLKECITKEGIQVIRIATGYWDMKGMALIYDELKAFLELVDTGFVSHLKLDHSSLTKSVIQVTN